jgi:hypothetical protein
MSCTVCLDCTLADLTPTRASAIVRLELAGRPDYASKVRSGEMAASRALMAVGLTKRITKERPLLVGTDAELRTLHDRTWLALSDAALLAIDAIEGDRVLVFASLACKEGPPERVQYTGIRGSLNRVWIVEPIDIDAVEFVTVRKKRRI